MTIDKSNFNWYDPIKTKKVITPGVVNSAYGDNIPSYFIKVYYDIPEYDKNMYTHEPKTELNNISLMDKQEDGSYVQKFNVIELPVDTVRANLKAAVTNIRWQAETSGVSFNGNTILTGIADQNRIATICLSAVSSKVKGIDFEPVKFKTASGDWVTLDADTLIAIGEAVTAHVEACFANEQRLHGLIDAANTFEELQAIDLNDGWVVNQEA